MAPIETRGPGLHYILKTEGTEGVLTTEMQCAMDGIVASIQKWFVDTRVTQVRTALAKLGWIAPDANMQDALSARCARCQNHDSVDALCYDACTGCIGHFPLSDRFKEKA